MRYCAQAITWMADHWEAAPERVNLLDPVPPTKRALLRHLRSTNPDLTVLWLPTVLLYPLSWLAIAAQKGLRPGRPAIDVAKVFSPQTFETAGSARLAARLGPREASTALVAEG